MTARPARYVKWWWWATSENGRCAVEEDFFDLPFEVRATFAAIMRRWLRGETTRREVGSFPCKVKGLRELRYASGNTHYRIIFKVEDGNCVALVVFGKKSNTAPKTQVRLAEKRAKGGSRRPYRGHKPPS